MSVVIGDYFVESNRVIGSGTWASVVKAFHVKTRTPVAIKVVPKYRNNKIDPTPINEIEALKGCKGLPGVVDLLDVYDDDENYFIVMEYVPGTLLHFISHHGPLSEEAARIIFKNLVEIIDGVHHRTYIHRDIKLENILFDPRTGTIRLCDFGMALKFSDYRHNINSEVIGSPGYIAPEILSKISTGYNGIKSDIYSLGVVLYTLLFGLFPFEDKDNIQYYDGAKLTPRKGEAMGFSPRKHMRAVPRRPSLTFPGEGASLEVRSMLHHILTTDFAKRASFAEIRKHSWITQKPSQQTPSRRPSIISGASPELSDADFSWILKEESAALRNDEIFSARRRQSTVQQQQQPRNNSSNVRANPNQRRNSRLAIEQKQKMEDESEDTSDSDSGSEDDSDEAMSTDEGNKKNQRPSPSNKPQIPKLPTKASPKATSL